MNAFLYLHPITHINCCPKLPHVYLLVILLIQRVTTVLIQSLINYIHQHMYSMRQSFLVFHIPRSAHPQFQPLLHLLTLGSIHYFYSILVVTTLWFLLLLLMSLVKYPLVNVLLQLFLFLHLLQTSLHHILGPQKHIPQP